MTKLLLAIKDIIMHEVEGKSIFTYHSFRVLLATQPGVSRRSGPEIQALCRWQSPASPAIYARMQPSCREAIAMLDGAQNAKITPYSTANLACIALTSDTMQTSTATARLVCTSPSVFPSASRLCRVLVAS